MNDKLSDKFTDFANLLENLNTSYDADKVKLQKMNNKQLDILHELELSETLTDTDISELGKKLIDTRKERRTYKDKCSLSEPVINYLKKNSNLVTELRAVAELIKNEETFQLTRVYNKRIEESDSQKQIRLNMYNFITHLIQLSFNASKFRISVVGDNNADHIDFVAESKNDIHIDECRRIYREIKTGLMHSNDDNLKSKYYFTDVIINPSNILLPSASDNKMLEFFGTITIKYYLSDDEKDIKEFTISGKITGGNPVYDSNGNLKKNTNKGRKKNERRTNGNNSSKSRSAKCPNSDK